MPDQFKETSAGGQPEGATNGASLEEQARDVGAKVMDAARERVKGSFEKQQHRAAEQISGVADALRDAADRLSEQDQGGTAKYVRTAADKTAQFADTIRDRGLDDLVAQAEGLARRQPELFVGGALLAGIALGRFLKATSNRRRMAGDIDVAVRESGYPPRYGDTPAAATDDLNRELGTPGTRPATGLNPQIIP